MNDKFAKLKEIIANQLHIDENSVTRDASFIDDLGADSIDAVELVMAIENEFGINIPENDAVNLKKIDDIINYIESKM
jgi:acyl carrier protein